MLKNLEKRYKSIQFGHYFNLNFQWFANFISDIFFETIGVMFPFASIAFKFRYCHNMHDFHYWPISTVNSK